MATCSQAEDYVAGKLSAGDTRAFEAHAASCATCAKALVRRKAVERAASVMRRNQVARDTRSDVPSAPNSQLDATPVSASELASVASEREESREPDLASGANGKRIAIAVGLVLTVGVAIALWSSSGTTQSQPEAPPVAAAPLPTEPTPEPQPQPVVAAPAEVPPPEPPHPIAEVPAKAPAPTPTKTDAKQQEWLPIGTDIEELASTVAGKRCGSAVTALRDRVTKNKAEARSWALLTTCYAKRKRWQLALDAYDMVVQYGDQALVASVQNHADAARAGQKAEAMPPPV